MRHRLRPQPTIYLLWALGDEETRRVIEAVHEYAIERVLEWIEDEVAVIRYGKDGIYRVRPPGGLVAARFRHYEARSGRPLLHDHLLLSVKGQRLDGKWGSIHTLALHENTVAASALYNELVAAGVCEALGLATEPRTVTPGRRPVMEIAGVPNDLIRWTARRSDQIAACLAELEHEYVTAVDDDGEPRFLPVVFERARAKMNQIAARKTRPPPPPAAAPGPDRQPPADPGEPPEHRPPGQDAGEWEIPRIPLPYERAALAGAVVREKLRTTATTIAVRGRAYDVVAHQQAAMPEQLLAPEPADPEHDDREQKPGRRDALDLTALRALRASRTDVEALDLTAERLRHLQDAFTRVGDGSRVRADRYTSQGDDTGSVRPDDQQAHRPQEPGPHCGREAGH
ncbi:relaxase domain-containing protein [Streptomyces somaliensis]|nr:relaxase domain-containing protein [Streptomyces somaliensis]MCP9963433.1 relaxase domain-containing protein [Streptomyces somaliensis]